MCLYPLRGPCSLEVVLPLRVWEGGCSGASDFGCCLCLPCRSPLRQMDPNGGLVIFIDSMEGFAAPARSWAPGLSRRTEGFVFSLRRTGPAVPGRRGVPAPPALNARRWRLTANCPQLMIKFCFERRLLPTAVGRVPFVVR